MLIQKLQLSAVQPINLQHTCSIYATPPVPLFAKKRNFFRMDVDLIIIRTYHTNSILCFLHHHVCVYVCVCDRAWPYG